MAFVNYSNGITIASPTPTGDAGLALQNDLIAIANFIGATNTTLASLASTYLPLAGGTITGNLTMTANEKLYLNPTSYIQGTASGYLNVHSTSNINVQSAPNVNLNGAQLNMFQGDGVSGNQLNLDSALLSFDGASSIQTDGGGDLILNCNAITVQQNNNAITFQNYDGFPLWILNTNDNIAGLPVFSLTNNDSGNYVFVITDNSGSNSSFEFYDGTAVVIDDTLAVAGATTLDSGQILTNGDGVITSRALSTNTIALTSGTVSINGSGTGASGSAQFVQTHTGAAFKKVVVYLSALHSPTAISWTFTNSFSHTPYLYGPMASYATASTTSVSLTTSSAQTGFLFIEGY